MYSKVRAFFSRKPKPEPLTTQLNNPPLVTVGPYKVHDMAKAELSLMDLQGLPQITLNDIRITNVQHLSSYNWIEADTPTIAVPGSPSLWTPPNEIKKLPKDSGMVYINQNADRHPDSPLEPLFRALRLTSPWFNLGDVDIVADRNNIRKLLSFIDPSLDPRGKKPFSMRIELVGKTALFERQDPATHEVIPHGCFRGYGIEFEKAFTETQIEGDTGHFRVVTYNFGGLKMVVRHETDGAVEVVDQPTASTPTISAMASLLTVRNQGVTVPLESTIEIKTAVQHRPIDIDKIGAQLWVSQTPKLVRAYYNWGIFQEANVEDVVPDIKNWEENHRASLHKLAMLIKAIVDKVKGLGGKATLSYDGEGSKLMLAKDEGDKLLPESLYSMWNLDALTPKKGRMKRLRTNLREAEPPTPMRRSTRIADRRA